MKNSIVSAENLTYLHDLKSTPGVSSLNFSLPTGSFTSLLGPSGSGKTTLLELIAGKLLPQKGLLRSPSPERIIFFTPTMLDDENGVLDFLISQPEESDEEKEKRIDRARELLYELDITHALTLKIKNLSFGERQRLVIAKLFMDKPTLILLDESFNGVDWIQKDIIIPLFKNLLEQKEVTALWVTQNTDDALKFTDRSLILNHGLLQQQGTTEEIINTPKNLFVAKFMGKKNVIVYSPHKEQQSKTCFGNIDKEIASSFLKQQKSESIILLKPFRCGQGEHKGEVISSYYQYGRYLNQIDFKERIFYAWSEKKHKQGEKIKFELDFSDPILLDEV